MTDAPVLVTGGSGFVASWILHDLLASGRSVRTTVRDLAKAEAIRSALDSDPGGRLQIVAADLDHDTGWAEAVAGCPDILHVASPMGGSGEGLIRAAVEGTRRVIAAGVAAGARRIVMTSSTAACTPDAPLGRPIDESDWTDPHQPDLSDYRRSKVLAERAAWDAVSGSQTELVTILPGAIFGPVRDKGHLSSVAFIARLLAGQPAALPRLGFNIIDVRDLSALHLAALAAPEAAGRRFIAIGEALWYADIARTLRERLGEPAAKVPTADLPDDTFRALAQSNAEMAALLPLLGRTQAFSSDAARQVLSFAPRPPQDTVADAGASLL